MARRVTYTTLTSAGAHGATFEVLRASLTSRGVHTAQGEVIASLTIDHLGHSNEVMAMFCALMSLKFATPDAPAFEWRRPDDQWLEHQQHGGERFVSGLVAVIGLFDPVWAWYNEPIYSQDDNLLSGRARADGAGTLCIPVLESTEEA